MQPHKTSMITLDKFKWHGGGKISLIFKAYTINKLIKLQVLLPLRPLYPPWLASNGSFQQVAPARISSEGTSNTGATPILARASRTISPNDPLHSSPCLAFQHPRYYHHHRLSSPRHHFFGILFNRWETLDVIPWSYLSVRTGAKETIPAAICFKVKSIQVLPLEQSFWVDKVEYPWL